MQRLDPQLVSALLNLASTAECFSVLDVSSEWDPVDTSEHGMGASMKQMTTWLPRHRIMCKLTRMKSSGHSVLQVADQVFFTTPEFSLHHKAPVGLVFYALFTQDRATGGGMQPRLLVYDFSGPAGELDMPDNASAQQRYDALRTRIGPAYLPLSTNRVIVVHWVGYFKSAHKVFEQDVGHEIEDLACLTSEPGRLVRPMRVQIPQNRVRFAAEKAQQRQPPEQQQS